MYSLEKIRKHVGNPYWFDCSEKQIQERLHLLLRQKATEYLLTGQGPVAKAFRNEYTYTQQNGDDYKEFLNQQSNSGAWGTYIELTALGEKMGFNIDVTPVKMGVEQKTFPLYRSDDKEAPTLHLYNSDNTHWYSNKNTNGDGNCLYNAIAQELQKWVKPQLLFLLPTPFTLWSKPKAETVKQQQEKLLSTYAKSTTTTDMDFHKEQERISKLSKEEQKQIADDYQFALKLAMEEESSPRFRKA